MPLITIQERLFSEQLIPVGKSTKDNFIFKQSIKFNSDQSKMTYVAKKDKKSIVYVNGDAGKLWDKIVVPTPIFSPDGDRVAYIGVDGKDVHLVVDGKPGPRFDKIWEVQFSPDSKHFAYLATLKNHKKTDAYLVINHRKGRKVLTIKQMRFSPDSRHLAYIAMLSDGKWHLILDNQKEGPGFDVMHSIVWSPDSKHLSYKPVMPDDQSNPVRGAGWKKDQYVGRSNRNDNLQPGLEPICCRSV